MSWCKLLRHDLACGLGRWRYLAVPLLFLLPCIVCRSTVLLTGSRGTWMDYMMDCFMGAKPVVYNSEELTLALPSFWLLAMGGCLFLNLDYLLHDLTRAGQQVILRSGKRRGWYLSKCLWNLLSCVLYILLAGAAVLVFTLLFGGRASLSNTPEITLALFYEVLFDPVALTPGQGLTAAVLLPLVSLMALSMLQMTLCLFLKPVVSFLISMALLAAAVYCNSPLAVGAGAMVIRSRIVVSGGISPSLAAATAVCVIVLSAGVGCVRFQYTDILSGEE